MKAWLRALTLAIALALALSAQAALADVAQWAESQDENSLAQQRIRNQQEALGAEVNTSVNARDITDQCKIKVSEGDRKKLTNGRVSNGWSYEKVGAWIGISLPGGVVPGAIRFEFRFEPTGYELIEYDANQNPLRTRTLSDNFPSIYTMFALLPETKLIQLRMTEPGQVVVNLKLYSEGILPNDVQTWLPPVEKADMMVFSTHQDDEVIFLGGTIPYSDVVCGRPTMTVYMTNCSRPRRREALECLWVMGSRHYPEFINLTDKRVGSINEGITLWGGKDNILMEMVARIRRYKPEVIVTQDFNGEYGHNQHKIMARAMPYAIQAAADPSKYPESYRLYGAWQVKKLYIHLYKENEIRMDWLTPQPACGGLTLLKVAQNGMAKHASQTKYYSVKDGGKYDNARFGLYMTQVGEDVNKNDFFENIPRDASAQYLASMGGGTVPAAQAASDDAGMDFDAAMQTGETEDAGLTPEEMGLAPEDGGAVSDAGDEALDEADEGILAIDGAETANDADAAVEAQPGEADEGAEDAKDQPAPGDAATERGGGAGLAIALVGAGIAAAGGGAWYLHGRAARNKRRRGRVRRTAGSPARQGARAAAPRGAVRPNGASHAARR